MDLENLETFIQVAETKSFSRSAVALGLSQPAVSKRIAALETQWSAKLFDRIGRSVQLTEAGRIVFPRAKQIQAELSAIRSALDNNSNEVSGVLSVGTTPYVATDQLLPALKHYRNAFSDVKLNLKLGTTEEMIKLMTANSLELAICPLPLSALTKLPSALQCIELWRNELKIVVANDNAMADADLVTIEELAINKAILPPEGSLAAQAITSAIAPGQVELNVAVRANNHSTMSSLAAIDMGWTCLPANCINDSLTVLNVPSLRLIYSVCLIRRRERTLSQAAEAFVGTLPESTAKKQKELTTAPN